MEGFKPKPYKKYISNIRVDKESIEVLERHGIDLYAYFKTYFEYLDEKYGDRY